MAKAKTRVAAVLNKQFKNLGRRHRAARAAAALKAGSRESRRVRRSAAEKELCNKTIIIPYEISDTIPVTRSLGRSAAGEGRTIRGRSGSGASLGHDPAAGSAGATLCTVAVWYGVTPVAGADTRCTRREGPYVGSDGLEIRGPGTRRRGSALRTFAASASRFAASLSAASLASRSARSRAVFSASARCAGVPASVW